MDYLARCLEHGEERGREMSSTWTSGRHGVPSLWISTSPVVIGISDKVVDHHVGT